MTNSNLLSKKSLLFVLLFLVAGGQTLATENSSDGSDSPSQNSLKEVLKKDKFDLEKRISELLSEKFSERINKEECNKGCSSIIFELMRDINKIDHHHKRKIIELEFDHEIQMIRLNTDHEKQKIHLSADHENQVRNLKNLIKSLESTHHDERLGSERLETPIPSSSSCLNKNGTAAIVFVAVLAGALIHYVYQEVQKIIKETPKTEKDSISEVDEKKTMGCE